MTYYGIRFTDVLLLYIRTGTFRIVTVYTCLRESSVYCIFIVGNSRSEEHRRPYIIRTLERIARDLLLHTGNIYIRRMTVYRCITPDNASCVGSAEDNAVFDIDLPCAAESDTASDRFSRVGHHESVLDP